MLLIICNVCSQTLCEKNQNSIHFKVISKPIFKRRYFTKMRWKCIFYCWEFAKWALKVYKCNIIVKCFKSFLHSVFLFHFQLYIVFYAQKWFILKSLVYNETYIYILKYLLFVNVITDNYNFLVIVQVHPSENITFQHTY